MAPGLDARREVERVPALGVLASCRFNFFAISSQEKLQMQKCDTENFEERVRGIKSPNRQASLQMGELVSGWIEIITGSSSRN